MNIQSIRLNSLRSLVAIVLLSWAISLGLMVSAHADSLYVGDLGDNTVKRFDAITGSFQGAFVKKGNSPLKSPMGIIFNGDGDLLVSNQNSGANKSGEILKHDGVTGEFLGALVSHNDPNAPFAARGIALAGNILFVSDLSGKGNDVPPGRLLAYTEDGVFLADITPDPITEFPGALSTDEFHPRAIALGPDGLLYVSVVHDLDPKSTNFKPTNPIAGWILRFDPNNNGAFVDVFASNAGAGCAAGLHRPEGMAFSPFGRLYVTAFRKGIADHDGIIEPEDTDKILVFNQAGECVDQIDLDKPTKPGITYVPARPRAFAQALEFGPDGQLFVPISGGGPDVGAVRRYNIFTKTFTNFIPPAAQGGSLKEGWYLTFR